jgi:hypothetical protein
VAEQGQVRSQPGSGSRSDPEQDTVGAEDYKKAFGESIANTLDLDTWQDRPDYPRIYKRVAAEVAEAVEQEKRTRNYVREKVFDQLRARTTAPRNSKAKVEGGVYQATTEQLEAAHRGVLFKGDIEACDGTMVNHDSLVLTVTQIGLCLVSYQGQELTLSQRLFYRDLRSVGSDPASEALALLQRRSDRSAMDSDDRRNTLSELATRGVRSYGERALLLKRSAAAWRLGHGEPMPYELLPGSGSMELLAASVEVVRGLVLDHKQFLFVPSTIRDRVLLTIGDALHPLEYAVVETAEDRMRRVVASGHYERGKRSDGKDWGKFADEFVSEVGPKVVVGVFRASRAAPPYPFFAHVDHVHEAAVLAMADASLQEHRGFPLLIDIADSVARSAFGADTFTEAIRSAYAEVGEPLRHFGERDTRAR